MNWWIRAESSPPYNLTNLIALVAVQGIADCISAVGVLFVASNLYRQLNKLCFHTSATRMDTTHQMSISSPTYRPQVVVSTSLWQLDQSLRRRISYDWLTNVFQISFSADCLAVLAPNLTHKCLAFSANSVFPRVVNPLVSVWIYAWATTDSNTS